MESHDIESHDEPVHQRLKVAHVMDCTPGNVESENGQPITILTLASGDEIEQPLALSIGDTQRLVVDFLTSLAAHGDDFALYLLDKYFTEEDEAQEEAQEESAEEEWNEEGGEDDDGEGWKKG